MHVLCPKNLLWASVCVDFLLLYECVCLCCSVSCWLTLWTECMRFANDLRIFGGISNTDVFSKIRIYSTHRETGEYWTLFYAYSCVCTSSKLYNFGNFVVLFSLFHSIHSFCLFALAHSSNLSSYEFCMTSKQCWSTECLYIFFFLSIELPHRN